MRCLACNCELTDFEATRKYAGSSHFIDLCNNCFSTIANNIQVIERNDLRNDYIIVEGDEDILLEEVS